MTIQQFIEKAIEEGWSVKHAKVLDIHENGMLYLKDDEEYEITAAEILLDPFAWKAVGKTEGWRFEKVGEVAEGYGIVDDVWKLNMHRMIEALISGKTLTEYLSTL